MRLRNHLCLFYNVITNLKDTPCWIFSRTSDELSDSANYELSNINTILQEDKMKCAKNGSIHQIWHIFFIKELKMTGKCTFT